MIYATLQAALNFWRNISIILKQWVFNINPYNWFVENKINVFLRFIVMWYIDVIKLSHINLKFIDEVLVIFKERCLNETPIVENWGKIHDYIVMKINYRK